jgi:hypothetical protein
MKMPGLAGHFFNCVTASRIRDGEIDVQRVTRVFLILRQRHVDAGPLVQGGFEPRH